MLEPIRLIPQDAELGAGQAVAPAPTGPLVAGIVAEYNPFHKGHEWMIRQLHKDGVEYVVCVMSGSFVQRAEGAYMPSHMRARAALEGGADLVLRLPISWATASAEAFARGGVGLLAALGCVDLLAFGAECDDVAVLEAVADVLLTDEFSLLLKEELKKGTSFAVARAAAAERLYPGAALLLGSPNNILGIEYIKALRYAVPQALRAKMPEDVQWRVVNGLFGNGAELERLFPLPVPVALPRVGAAHDGVPQQGFASASWLRQLARQRGVSAWADWVPEHCMPVYQKTEDEGMVLNLDRYETMMLSRLRGMSPEEMAMHPGAGEGLESRLAAAAKRATTLEQLFDIAKSKRFAHSRVRRLALASALALPASVPTIPPFAQVLAANGRGLTLLKWIKERSMVPVSTSLAKLKDGPNAGDAVKMEANVEDLYSLCLEKPRPGGGAFTQPAAILAKSREILP